MRWIGQRALRAQADPVDAVIGPECSGACEGTAILTTSRACNCTAILTSARDVDSCKHACACARSFAQTRVRARTWPAMRFDWCSAPDDECLSQHFELSLPHVQNLHCTFAQHALQQALASAWMPAAMSEPATSHTIGTNRCDGRDWPELLC